MVLEKTLESPLDCKEVKPVNSKGNQPSTFTGMTDAEAEAPIFWAPRSLQLVIAVMKLKDVCSLEEKL